MNTIKNKNIAIIGGGPGGLTLARILQMNGASVKVYERDVNRSVRVQGATLDLHDESGLKALRKANLTAEFKANYRPGADHMRITNQDAHIIYEDGFDGDDEHARPEIDRGPLREILLDSLRPDTVVWDCNFAALEQKGDAFELQFKNETTAHADVVIAADGANSKIRPYITFIEPFYSGVTAVEGAVYESAINSPKIHALLKGGKIFAMGDSKTLIVSSKGDGSMAFYVGFKTGEFWVKESGIDFADKAQVLAWFKKVFSTWDNIWHELFENASSAFVPRPQYCMPLNQTWESQPNLTMLGDAAHLMPPYAGEGVNMAMLDALELAESLLSDAYTDTQTAIAAFEKQMLARFAVIGQITLQQTESLHSPDAIKNMVAMLNGE